MAGILQAKTRGGGRQERVKGRKAGAMMMNDDDGSNKGRNLIQTIRRPARETKTNVS
jgi:hypothetical protein